MKFTLEKVCFTMTGMHKHNLHYWYDKATASTRQKLFSIYPNYFEFFRESNFFLAKFLHKIWRLHDSLQNIQYGFFLFIKLCSDCFFFFSVNIWPVEGFRLIIYNAMQQSIHLPNSIVYGGYVKTWCENTHAVLVCSTWANTIRLDYHCTVIEINEHSMTAKSHHDMSTLLHCSMQL